LPQALDLFLVGRNKRSEVPAMHVGEKRELMFSLLPELRGACSGLQSNCRLVLARNALREIVVKEIEEFEL